MPELPDVAYLRKYFDEHALQRKIKDLEVLQKRMVRGGSPKELEKVLANDTFKSTDRHGKWLLIKTKKGKCLAMHFGMTGNLEFLEDGEMPKSARVVFEFTDHNKLIFTDRRMLGGMELVKDKDELIKKHHLGPDALDISWDEFREALKGKKGKVKPVLMDQSILAGIGNLYADEILFQAKVHPESSVNHLDEKELKKIYSCIQLVLKTAIKHMGKRKGLPDSYLLPHREKGGECPCGGNVEIIEVGGRTTYFCPSCQKKA